MKLLTSGNQKIEKGEKLGYTTYGVHLAPFNLSGRNVCSHASDGCAMACLNTSGRGQMTSIQQSRIKKTQYLFNQKKEFMQQLQKEVQLAVNRGQKKGMKVCFRLNLTSDLPWENMKLDGGLSIFETFPDVQWYDYTKNPNRMYRFLRGELPSNYHLTFSRSESNQGHVEKVLREGGNVAAVFRNALPKEYIGHEVISGDETDLRFLDKRNCVVGLTEKGLAKKDLTGFVIG